MTKTEINAIVQARYDELMREGKHGHYENMFKIIHEQIAIERKECAKEAEKMPYIYGTRAGKAIRTRGQT